MSAMKGFLPVLCASLLALPASAQDRRPEYGPSITITAAKKIAAATLAECQANNWNVAVAIVDTHGELVYFEWMENTQTASMRIAIDKARAAAMFRRTTGVFMEVINKSGPAVMTLPGVIASPGGNPVFVDGRVIGGVGVSGVTGDQDEQCAKAVMASM